MSVFKRCNTIRKDDLTATQRQMDTKGVCSTPEALRSY
jgi:hypothetical protein